jgi:hypothetical protein
MKCHFHSLALVCVIITSMYSVSAQETQLRIAVNNLRAEGVDSSTANIITDRICSEMIGTQFFRIIERTEIEKILREKSFQNLDVCDDRECLLSMGKILNADCIVFGTAGKTGNVFTLSLRMINVATGEMFETVNEDCVCPIEVVLSKAVPAVAIKLAEKVGNKSSTPASVYKTGDLYISTDVPGASIEIDAKQYQNTTPATIKDLSVGMHVIVVKKDSLYGSKRIDLAPDDLLRVCNNIS